MIGMNQFKSFNEVPLEGKSDNSDKNNFYLFGVEFYFYNENIFII